MIKQLGGFGQRRLFYAGQLPFDTTGIDTTTNGILSFVADVYCMAG